MFPDLFDYFRADLAEDLGSGSDAHVRPLPCDRWIARSALQKAVRRGDVDVAERALATLLLPDPRGTWRSLVIIALEDLGVVGIDVLGAVVAAAQDKAWRKSVGGDWTVARALVRRMAASVHCQAVCDLLMQSTNTPWLEEDRIEALDSGADLLRHALIADDTSLERRALVALALGGGLVEGQARGDPDAVFHALGETGRSTHVLATCQASWRITRNPMALMLPLLWSWWMDAVPEPVKDDALPPTAWIGGVPAYAIDQFTRTGLASLRAYLRRSPPMHDLMDRAAVAPSARVRVLGDVLFLAEGSPLARRGNWHQARRLRCPRRPLKGSFLLAERCDEAVEIVLRDLPLINELRAAHLHTPDPGSTP